MQVMKNAGDMSIGNLDLDIYNPTWVSAISFHGLGPKDGYSEKDRHFSQQTGA